MQTVYLDNAATSWPKPAAVSAAMVDYLAKVGANSGRSGHRQAIVAGTMLDATRAAVAEFFGANDPLRVVFTANVTEALNLALLGLLNPGDHVVTSSLEHNSVMRPLRHLEAHGVELSVVDCGPVGSLAVAEVATALRPNTKLLVFTHASNVTGTILPVAELGRLARAKGLLLLVDAATTAGVIPLHLQTECIDLLAFTGHKSLLGPTGTGGLILGERVDAAQLRPLLRGGTGSRSAEEQQPEFLPDCFESGTRNLVGLAGLLAALEWLQDYGLDNVMAHHQQCAAQLAAGLAEIPGVRRYGAAELAAGTSITSFTVAGASPSEIGFWLDDEFAVAARVGLHCAPAAHRTIGTFPVGTVRFTPGIFTTASEIEQALAAVAHLAKRVRR